MKKNDILELIRAHVYNNDATFRSISYDIAREFNENGDEELADYILSLLSSSQNFVAQSNYQDKSNYFNKLNIDNQPLYLPDKIKEQILGIINVVNKKIGINKFLFQGDSGTGKTQTAMQLSRLLNRDIYSVNFETVIDSKLGQTQKNIVSLFKEINSFSCPSKIIVLFDEIDALALDRVNTNDLREMGRATSTLLKELEKMSDDLVLIATTNLYEKLDKALIRRFDAIINFNDYSKEDIFEIATLFVSEQSKKIGKISINNRLLYKIINLFKNQLTPGYLKNLIKISIAFSDPQDGEDYLRLIYNKLPKQDDEIEYLSKNGFTTREIELLTGVSKSKVSRLLGGK